MFIVPQTHGDLTLTPINDANALADGLGPANEAVGTGSQAMCVTDMNMLVAKVVGRVSAMAIADNVDFELDLAPVTPLIAGIPGELSFVIAGVLAAEIESIEDNEEATIRVVTQVDRHTVSISIMSNTLPLLRYVRAVSEGPDASKEPDPTLAHCRRLIEAHGGNIELTGNGELLGFCVAFPAISRAHPARQRPGTVSPTPIQTKVPLKLAAA